MSENNVERLKIFAQSEREKLREHFTRRASQAPIVNVFDAASIRVWDEYVAEMHELEQQLRDTGDQL